MLENPLNMAEWKKCTLNITKQYENATQTHIQNVTRSVNKNNK